MAARTTYRFEWVDEDEPFLGGQWVVDTADGTQPVVLADAVASGHDDAHGEGVLETHVRVVLAVVDAAGDLEDQLLPQSVDRLDRLAGAQVGEPEIDPLSDEGARVQAAASALEKLAADLAELVEEQLGEGGSLASLPPDSTRALCVAVQTAWRLRHRVSPPGPLFL